MILMEGVWRGHGISSINNTNNNKQQQVTGIYERFVAKRYLMDFHKFKEAALHMVRLYTHICTCIIS